MSTVEFMQFEEIKHAIPDSGDRQSVYEALTEDIDDLDLNDLYTIICTAEGGKEWFESSIPNIIRAYYGAKIEISDINASHTEFIAKLTSDEIIMRRVNNGRTWDTKQVKSFITWCEKENNQSPKVRKNYYHLITERDEDGKAVPIGVVGVTMKKKYNPPGGINYNLVVFIDYNHQHYGAGTSAIAKCLEQYWSIHHGRKINVNIPVDKEDMVKVAKKLGMVHEGEFKAPLCRYYKFAAYPSSFEFNPDIHLPPNERRKVYIRRNALRAKK